MTYWGMGLTVVLCLYTMEMWGRDRTMFTKAEKLSSAIAEALFIIMFGLLFFFGIFMGMK